MNRMDMPAPLEQIQWIGQLADLKELHYQNSLILSAIVDLLLEKAILTREEIAVKAEQLERLFETTMK